MFVFLLVNVYFYARHNALSHICIYSYMMCDDTGRRETKEEEENNEPNENPSSYKFPFQQQKNTHKIN